MANRHIKRAKDDLLEEIILVSKPEPFFKRTITFILTMARILYADFLLSWVDEELSSESSGKLLYAL
jgi:hypothetical protein